ncbi:hypothetical protein RIF29_21661 [Crotalaria pallida]|uniref:RNase H type-1 domain-containing protein n=1 Tax=Crotalaria pallida TaxID=3830 RepID=A0AAN9F7V5_CROPI
MGVAPEFFDHKVAHYVRDSCWDWPLLRNFLSSKACGYLATTRPPNPKEGDDFPTWKLIVDGTFSIKSAYLQCVTSDLVHHVNPEVSKVAPETVMHVLRDCEFIRTIWDAYISEKNPNWCHFHSVGLDQWLVLSFVEQVSKVEILGVNIQNCVEANICWIPPLAGYAKLNVDGSLYNDSGSTGCGTLGLLYGLELASSLGMDRVIIELDSKTAITLVEGQYPITHHCYSLVIRRIRSLLLQQYHVVIRHVFREANRSADFLVNLGHSYSFDVHYFLTPPIAMLSVSREDNWGVSLPRFISIM